MPKLIDFERIGINIRSVAILDKKRRKLYRAECLRNLRSKRAAAAVKERTWGVSYSAFDGDEILEGSLRSIRGEADYINVIYQTQSWYGDPLPGASYPAFTNYEIEAL